MIMAFSFGNCFASQVQVSDEGAYNVYQKVINTMVAKGENRDIGNLVQSGKSENGLYDIWLFQTNGVAEMFWVNGAGYVSEDDSFSLSPFFSSCLTFKSNL